MFLENRLGMSQNRMIDQAYSGSSSLYTPNIRATGMIPQPQAHYRGGPSPTLNQPASMQNQIQRLPPGLANLGGRPPHDPSQYGGMSGYNPAQNPPSQQYVLNNSHLNQMRMPVGLQNPSPQQVPLGNLLHNNVNGLDLRTQSQGQMYGNISRGAGGYVSPANPPLHNPTYGMRPTSQQSHLPLNLVPQMMPPQMSHHGHPSNAQSAELMALLMGGPARE
jgi:zinc finger CCCH domain-containing protein 13